MKDNPFETALTTLKEAGEIAGIEVDVIRILWALNARTVER